MTKFPKNLLKMCSFWAFFLTYLSIFFVVLPWICHRWPYSMFFHSDVNDPEIVRQVVNDNDLRILVAQDFLRSYLDIKKTSSAEEPVDLVVAVITINRDSDNSVRQLGYLTQTVASVLSVIQNDQSEIFRNKIVFICNVDIQEIQHSEAVYLSRFVRVVSRFPNGTVGLKRQHIFEKEKSDYVFCLQEAYNYNPRYILMMEDDVLLYHNSFMTLNHLLRSRVAPHEDNPIPWLFTKLYYPEKWQGYAYEPDKVGELIGITLLGGTVFEFFAFKLSNRRCTTKTRISALFVVGAMTSTIIVVLIGRPYIRSWRSFLPYTHRLVRAPDCCTQAVLYPASIVEGLAKYLSEVVCNIDFSVDLAIDAFASEHGLRRHLVEPNVCRHIGFVSTIRNYAKEAAEFLE